MATPGELVKVIAATLGEDEATVTQHDRNLLLAGLRSKGGRGRSAAKVTARDAANLLTSVLGSHRVKDGVAAVQRYIKTQEHRAHWAQYWPADKQNGMGPANVWEHYGIPELAALKGDHTFIDVLTVLIDLATEGRLIPQMRAFQGHVSFDDLRITLTWPRTHARIHMNRWRSEQDSKSVQANYHSSDPPPDWLVDLKKMPPREKPTTTSPRLDRWVETNAMPLLYVGALLAGELNELPPIAKDAS